jgi:TolA-binding protein
LASLLEAERAFLSGHRTHPPSSSNPEAGNTVEHIKQSRIEQLEMQIDYLHQSQEELEKVRIWHQHQSSLSSIL